MSAQEAEQSHREEIETFAATSADMVCAITSAGPCANASRKSHAELNESTEIDVGDPIELGRDYARVKRRLRHLNVMGGCCGTDHRHVEQIALACLPLFGTAA